MPSATYAGFVLLRSNLKSARRGRHRQGSRIWQARQALSALEGSKSTSHEVRRCDRRRIRQHDPLRRAFLSDARPLRAARAVADRDKVMIDQLKTIGIEKGKPFDPDARPDDPHRRRARSARLARRQVQGHLLAAIQRGHALGAARDAGCGRRDDDEFLQPRHLSCGRPRGFVFDGVFQRQTPRRGPVLPDDDRGQGRASRSRAAGPIGCTCRRTRR